MVLAVDFDHTIQDNDHPVPGRRMGPPMPGAKEAMERLHRLGHQVIIHSCNRSKVIADWMQYYQIPYHSIWDQPGKPVADRYIDDKGLHFESWEQTLRELEAWNE